MRLTLIVSAILIGLCAALYAIGLGWFGEGWQPAKPIPTPRPAAVVAAAESVQSAAREPVGVPRDEGHDTEILFGDLHVHSTFSIDAFFMSLPSAGGDGLHPVSDACDFARYCSALDFFSINDHAVTLTRARWQDTIDEIRACNAVTNPNDPDLVAFLGWEWTQAGLTANTHYGHKNVILKGLADDEVPARPISALSAPGGRAPILNQRSAILTGAAGLMQGGRQETLRSAAEFRDISPCPNDVPERELDENCLESVATPAELFAKLDDWGYPSLVIPHGTTWGMYTPPGSAWDKQLRHDNHDANRQRLIEVYSGHGNSEEFRDFREVIFNEDGSRSCPEPTAGYTPGCWRAGEIIYERCIAEAASAAQCNLLAGEARQNFLDAPYNTGDKTIPGATPADWRDAGQCTDCWAPSFNYRPRSSAQYILALRNFDEAGNPRGFHFGFIGSSDNHSARPGTGYKEFARDRQTEARFPQLPAQQIPPYKPKPAAARSVPIMEAPVSPFLAWNFERAGSWFMSGGLVAVHARSRRREDIWNALWRREVYATSGPRILLWFDIDTGSDSHPMGSDVAWAGDPVFTVRAIGSLQQKPGCPDYATDAMTSQRIENLCNGECYNPSNVRRRITRIEVVRIRPQAFADEDVSGLVDDPFKVIDCPGDRYGCTATFTDPDYAGSGRDAIYYVRAIEEPSMAIGAEPFTCERDAEGNCMTIRLCDQSPGDCMAMTEERAWSSPIYLTHRLPGGVQD